MIELDISKPALIMYSIGHHYGDMDRFDRADEIYWGTVNARGCTIRGCYIKDLKIETNPDEPIWVEADTIIGKIDLMGMVSIKESKHYLQRE
jgi:hypothetical protein